MFLRAASEDRPYHLGSFPEEVLPRDARVRRDEAARPASAMRYRKKLGPTKQKGRGDPAHRAPLDHAGEDRSIRVFTR